MTRLLACLALSLGWIAPAALAQSEGPAAAPMPVVVELFTSQGCSSCPPADAMIGELAGHEDVIALSLHVDYWNYLGWADTFSQAAFTERQYGYGHAAGSTMVYTPQLIVGGRDHVMGARAMEVADLIAAHRAAPKPVALEIQQVPAGVLVRARWIGDAAAPDMIVQLVNYAPREVVEITRGENAGLTAEYSNVVRQWQTLSDWDGAEAYTAEIALDPDLRDAIIVQAHGHGPIFAAARLD